MADDMEFQDPASELQHMVAARPPAMTTSPSAYVLTLPTLGPVFTTTLLLADVPLRYFYLYYRGSWGRFAFQGSIDDFQQAIAQHSRLPPPSLTARRYPPRLVGSVACHMMHLHRKPVRRHLLPAHSITDTAPLPPAPNKPSHLMRWPSELRDLVYDYCISESFVVYARGRSVFVTSAAVATANSQMRTGFCKRLHARRAQLPAMVFFEPHVPRDWSDIFCTHDNEAQKARVCIELDAVPDYSGLLDLWRQMRHHIPELPVRHVTFILLSGVHATSATNPHTLADPGRHPLHLFRVVSKLDLTLFETGQRSGFTVYFRPVEYNPRAHLLRSDDWPGYLSLIYRFVSPTAGDYILKSLLWHRFPVVHIDATEQRALRRGLSDRPADNAAMAILPWHPAGGEVQKAS